MEYKIRLTAALPKGSADGWNNNATIPAALSRPRPEGRDERPHAAIIIYDVRTVEMSKDQVVTAVLEILRVQPLQSEEGRRQAEQMLGDEYAYQHGGGMLPFELASLSEAAFADLSRTAGAVDRAELAEQDLMSPTDELRRHLDRVHGRAESAGMTALEAEHRHEADHAGDLPDVLQHEPDWIGWTRADIEAATAYEDDGMPTNDEIEGPDPDYGRDLDDEDDTQPLFSEGAR